MHRNGRGKGGFQSCLTSVCGSNSLHLPNKNLLTLQQPQAVNRLWQDNEIVVPRFCHIYNQCQKFVAEASVKRHFYFAMKNCTTTDDLRRRLLTVVDHYQACICVFDLA